MFKVFEVKLRELCETSTLFGTFLAILKIAKQEQKRLDVTIITQCTTIIEVNS